MTSPDPPLAERAAAVVARLGVSRSEGGALLVLGLAAVAAFALVWWLQRPPGAGQPPLGAAPAAAPEELVIDSVSESEEVIVHVAGLVRTPGLHRLPAGARVADALEAAGGPRHDAWLDGLNLARPLHDGEQLLVPAAPDPADGSTGSAPGAAPGAGLQSGPGGLRPDGRVDLNLATASELETLPGIGPVMAERVVQHREDNGPFTSVGELRDVPGVGEKTFQNLVDLVGV